MSGKISRRRKRKVRRERNKDEIRCCVEVFADVITNSDSQESFPNRENYWLTERRSNFTHFDHSTSRGRMRP